MTPIAPSMLLLLCAGAAAQVRPGQAIAAMFANNPPMEGLMLAERGGTCTVVTGAGALNIQDVNAVKLDPIDGRLWIGSIQWAASVGGTLRHLRLSGSTVIPSSVTTVATLPTAPTLSISAIAFDVNCNPVCASGEPTVNGGLFVVNRNTGVITNLLAGSGLPGTVNGLDHDPSTGDLYFGMYIFGLQGTSIYKLTAPNYSLPATPLGTIAPPATWNYLSGVAFAPASATRPASVYWSCLFRTTPCGFLPATGGPSVLLPPLPTSQNANWIEYDRSAGDFWVLTGSEPDSLWTVTPSGAATLVCSFPPGGINGAASAIAVNDTPSGTLRACPQFLPAVPAPTQLELGLWWQPGDLGVVVMTQPFVAVLGFGPIDASGNLSFKFPLTLGAGSPGAFEFIAASVDVQNFVVRGVTAPLRWPAN